MAGYSGTPLLRKLGIQESHRVLVRNAPARLPQELQAYSAKRLSKDLDVVLFFVQSAAALQTELAPLTEAIKVDGMIWIAWPKKSSGIQTDLTDKVIRDHVLTTPFVDVKVCAIDEIWSGLKFVLRKEHRTAFAARAI